MKFNGSRTLLAALFLCAPACSEAKVVFTGYADLRYTAGTDLNVTGTPAALTSLGIPAGATRTGGFNPNTIGLFANTQIQKDLQFFIDINFQNIASQVGQLNMNYAYAQWTPLQDTTVKVGKVTLPFGYYNENRFYAFQRYSVTSPVFQSSFLGLPISDWGVTAQQRFPMAPFTVEATAFAVNGYESQPTNAEALRLPRVPGVSPTNTLTINSSSGNQEQAVGGRLALTNIGGAQVETGGSYYWEKWDTSGLEPMNMIDAYVHAHHSGLDLLVEALHVGVRGDQGFAQALGDPNWSTDGGFATASYDDLKVKGKQVAPFVQVEEYRSRPDGGGSARETLKSWSSGVALRATENLLFKAEYLHTSYELPMLATAGWVRLEENETVLSAVVTF